MSGSFSLLLLVAASLGQHVCGKNAEKYVANCVPATSIMRMPQELAPTSPVQLQTFQAAAPTMFADLALLAKGEKADCLAAADPMNEGSWSSWTSAKFLEEHRLALVPNTGNMTVNANETYFLVAKSNVARDNPKVAACVPMRVGAHGAVEQFLKKLYPDVFGDLLFSSSGPYRACLEAMSEVNRGNSPAPDQLQLHADSQGPSTQGTLLIFQNSLQDQESGSFWTSPVLKVGLVLLGLVLLAIFALRPRTHNLSVTSAQRDNAQLLTGARAE